MSTSIYRVLVLGDFHFGESYGGGGQKILRDSGYGFSTEYLRPFLERADKAIVNLETPLAFRQYYVGQFSESKTYVHWADPIGSAQALADLGVDAVGLANNHTMDLGSEALEATLDVLNEFGILPFGAGSNRKSAERPYRIHLPAELGGGEIQLYAFFEFRRRYRDEYAFYATRDQAGCALFSRRYIPSTVPASDDSGALRVAFPHWGQNYVWRSEKQEQLALKLLSAGYDLVLGHGAHSLQEIHCLNDRWVAYSIGNGNFQSPGRWAKYREENGIFPFGLWTMLEVQRDGDGLRKVASKYYPVYLDNRVTNFQPRPVNKEDFDVLAGSLEERQGSVPGELGSGLDDLGYFLEVDHGHWAEGRSLNGHVEGSF